MSEQPIQIGIIGAGNNTRVRHIPGLQAIGGVEVGSGGNCRPGSSHRAAEQFGLPKICGFLRGILADQGGVCTEETEIT